MGFKVVDLVVKGLVYDFSVCCAFLNIEIETKVLLKKYSKQLDGRIPMTIQNLEQVKIWG